MAELKLQVCFPRLDVNVSKDLNHLLKSPFCVHPKTGQVCVPFEAEKAFEFQTTQVPTILTLIDELHALDKDARRRETVDSSKSEKVVLEALSDSDYEKTSRAPHMKDFRRFVHEIMKHELMKESLSKTGQTLSSEAKRACICQVSVKMSVFIIGGKTNNFHGILITIILIKQSNQIHNSTNWLDLDNDYVLC